MEAELDSQRAEVFAHKGNTVQKLVHKFWHGGLSRLELAAKLPAEIWEALKDINDEETMCRVAKTCTNRAKKNIRLQREEQKSNKKAAAGQGILSQYGLLAAPSPDVSPNVRANIDWTSAPVALIPEFNSETLRDHFERRHWALLAEEMKSLRKRRLHIEYVVGLALSHLEARRAAGLQSERLVVVGDSSDFALVLAWELQKRGTGETVTLLEPRAESVAKLQKCATILSLSCDLFEVLPTSILDYDASFDLAISLGAAGSLADRILSRCLPSTLCSDIAPSYASFILFATELGHLHLDTSIDIPPAGGAAIESVADFTALCNLANSSHAREANMAARIINSDRVAVCRRMGVWAELCSIPGTSASDGLIILDVPSGVGSPDIRALHLPVKQASDEVFDEKNRVDIFRIVTVSDTHGRHDSIHIPPADLLVVCGDFTRAGSEDEISDFADWLQKQPCKHKVVVAGNHDITFDTEYFLQEGQRFQKNLGGQDLKDLCARCQALLKNCPGVTYLENEVCSVGPVRVWGSPCQGQYFSRHSMAAFTIPQGCEKSPWKEIPDGVDIIVTHGPPSGIGDLSGEGEGPNPKRAGCPTLRDEVQRVQPLLHLFGHIHEGYGAYCNAAGTVFINASSCTERYLPTRLPIVVDLHLSPGSGGEDKCSVISQAPSLWLAQRPVGDKDAALLATVSASPVGGPSTYGAQKPDIARPLPLFARLVKELHDHPDLYDKSGTSSYRNKASYLLGSDFSGENPMCEPALNRVAAKLQECALELEAQSASGHFVECGLKLTRSGQIGVKLVVRDFDVDSLVKKAGSDQEKPPWLASLLNDISEVMSVTIQPCPPGSESAKPVRSPWMPGYVKPLSIYGPPYVIENAPLADAEPAGVTFRLSPDSFSEINSPAEDAMFARVSQWVRPWRKVCPRLATFGRNGGFYGLALQRAFHFDEVSWCTHCPETLADTEASIVMHAGEAWLKDGSSTFKTKQVQKNGFCAEIRALEGGPPTVVHVTNSRHGLADGIVQALLETDAVQIVVYNSCNQQPLAVEWAQFCVPGGFEISKFASSDLLAGTEYESAVFLLCRQKKKLILPVGPPASGKTLLWQTINSIDNETSRNGACLVQPFERDRVYACERAKLGGMRGAKVRTHAVLEKMLGDGASRRGSCVYIDSTNGQRDARAAYRAAFKPDCTIYCLLGFSNHTDFTIDAELVMSRVLARHSRVGLPAHEQRQWENVMQDSLQPKLERMLQAMQALTPEELNNESSVVLDSDSLSGQGVGSSLITWRLFLELCCPALLEVQNTICKPSGVGIPSTLSLGCSRPRIALCFLTSALRAPAPLPVCNGSNGGLWNESAWKWLAQDFEKKSGAPLESMFSLLVHDDSICDGMPSESFLSRAVSVPPVPTARASLSLVLAELRLIRAALSEECDMVLILSGSCLPLVTLSELHRQLIGRSHSVLQYHFMRGGQQRSLGVPYGSLQWKVWRKREARILAAIDEEYLCRRWTCLEEHMRRQNLAADEVVLVNELHERAGALENICERRPITYTQWEEREANTDGPVHACTFDSVPEAAWRARGNGTLLCRKLALQGDAMDGWRERLLGDVEVVPSVEN